MSEKPCKCVECAGKISYSYMEPFKSRMEERGLCFFCLFWMDYYDRVDSPECVRAEGQHYVICPDTTSGLRGFGGREFTIEFFDGRSVTSRNLWSQGTIPPHFTSRLPDNARVVNTK